MLGVLEDLRIQVGLNTENPVCTGLMKNTGEPDCAGKLSLEKVKGLSLETGDYWRT